MRFVLASAAAAAMRRFSSMSWRHKTHDRHITNTQDEAVPRRLHGRDARRESHCGAHHRILGRGVRLLRASLAAAHRAHYVRKSTNQDMRGKS
jgi:hypothetical protein